MKTVLIAAVLVVGVLIAAANADGLRVNNPARDSGVALQCVDRDTSVLVQNPTWFKNGFELHDSSRITINGNDGTITFSPARPRDEGVYRCRLNLQLSEGYRLKVRPHVPEEFSRVRHMFRGLGTNFTLPCGITIGNISREDRHMVEWVLFMDPPSHNASYTRLFSYDSNQDRDTIFNNGSYQFNPSRNFSLLVTDFTVTSKSLQKHVVYFRCSVDTFGVRQMYPSHTTTAVTFAFDSAMVLSPPPPLTVAHPGDNITVEFEFRGYPDPQIWWMFGDDSLDTQRAKYRQHLQLLAGSSNITRAQLTVSGLDELDTGVLAAQVQVCGSKDSTSTMVVTIPHIRNVTVHNGTSNVAPCGTQNLTLSFSLPTPIPVDSLKLKINFSEVLGPANITGVGESTTQIYSAPSIFNTTQVQFSIAGNLPQVVKKFARFRIQVKLVVNGTEGRRWSEMSQTIQTNCTLPETEVLELGLQFAEGRCSSLSQDHERLQDFAVAIQQKIHRNCTFQCEHLTVDHPHLECSSDTFGTLRANLSAYAASAQLERFYQWVEYGTVDINGTTLCKTDCPTVPPVAVGPNALLICVVGMAGVVVVLVLLIVVLIAVVVMKKRRSKDDHSEDMELPQVQTERPPAPLPRPQDTLPNEQYENMPLPLSRAGELVDEQLQHNESYIASENTGSTMYISEVASVPTARIPPPTTSTHPRSEPMISTFYARPISATPPPFTHLTPPITPPTSPRMQFSTARTNHTIQSPPPPYTTAVTHSHNCHQRSTPPAFYPSTTSPGYSLHTPPASPTCTIATVFHTKPTHFPCPSPKRMTMPNTCNHDNQCVRCGLPLESVSDSRIPRSGYISQDEALRPNHSSTGTLKSNFSTQQHHSLTCLKPAEECLNDQHLPPSYPGLPKSRKRHGSLPLDGYKNGAREKSPDGQVSCRDGYTMHALDLGTRDESRDRATKRSHLPAQLRMSREGYVLQVKEYCQPKLSSKGKAPKCTQMGGNGYAMGLETVQPKTPNSQHNSSSTLPCSPPGGYLTHYPCEERHSNKRKGSATSEKDPQMHHKQNRNGYVQQPVPVRPTETAKPVSASRRGTDLENHTDPPQVVQLPDNVAEGDGELFRTQLWLLHQYSVTSEQDSTDKPS